jgi:fructose-1,6-bisphosphatase I
LTLSHAHRTRIHLHLHHHRTARSRRRGAPDARARVAHSRARSAGHGERFVSSGRRDDDDDDKGARGAGIGDTEPARAIGRRSMSVEMTRGALEIGETTLERYLDAALAARAASSEGAASSAIAEDEASVVRSMAKACVRIGGFVRRAGLKDVKAFVEGKNGAVNVHGEEQAALDDAAHEVCVKELIQGGRCAWIASEESEDIVTANVDGRIAVVFDPLDGSSNIECGVGVGTIFGLVDVGAESSPEHVYARPGRDMSTVGYVLYGASMVLVLSFMSEDAHGGVCAFTYDADRDAFVLTKRDIRIPESGNVYSVNQANYKKWDDATRAYIDECASSKSLRYIGSMVADVHRTLLYGGTFHYPACSSNAQGKLRAVYECFPMAAIIERAGGLAISGANDSVLSFVPSTAHSRMPFHCGSARDIERLDEILSSEVRAGKKGRVSSPSPR